jgi:hypothetical protein
MATSRDGAFTALIFGFFGMGWFGWAQSAATPGESVLFSVGSVLAALVFIAGGVLTFRARHEPGTADDASTGRRFGVIVGIETGLCLVGSMVLGATGQPVYIPAWIALVVGLHFIPLAPLFGDRRLPVLAAAVTVAAVAGAVIALTNGTPTSTTSAPAAGLALIAYGAMSLFRRPAAS